MNKANLMTQKTTADRIKADAEAYATGMGDVYRKYAAQYGYIAGATAENSRIEPIVKLLEEIAESNCDYEDVNFKTIHGDDCRACKAKEVLYQFKDGKGKEVCNG